MSHYIPKSVFSKLISKIVPGIVSDVTDGSRKKVHIPRRIFRMRIYS